MFFPPKTPDLIGIKNRHYLDATGLIQHRSIDDLMRYAATVDGAEDLAAFDAFRVVGELPDPATRKRFSDEQLYALALYIYSLTPPTNPNGSSPLSVRGERMFRREGCAGCHTPPLYTNNMLTPVDGFLVSERAQGPLRDSTHIRRHRPAPRTPDSQSDGILPRSVLERGLVPRAVRAQRICCIFRGMVRSSAVAERLRAHGLEAVEQQDPRRTGSCLWSEPEPSGWRGPDCVPEDALGAAGRLRKAVPAVADSKPL